MCTLHHRRDSDEQKAVVVVETSLPRLLSTTQNMLVRECILGGQVTNVQAHPKVANN